MARTNNQVTELRMVVHSTDFEATCLRMIDQGWAVDLSGCRGPFHVRLVKSRTAYLVMTAGAAARRATSQG